LGASRLAFYPPKIHYRIPFQPRVTGHFLHEHCF
jgi:hypothetical protein